MATRETPRYIAVNPVKASRRSEFETFLREVVVPAVEKVRPEDGDLWDALRPAGSADGGHVFVFYGDDSLDDWSLDALLRGAYGDEEGSARMEEFEQFLDGEQVVYEFAGSLLHP
jgi:hypothetical protein